MPVLATHTPVPSAHCPASPDNGKSGPGSDSVAGRYFGYNYQSDRESDADARAMYYQQKMIEAEGVALSNPCDGTKAIMETELER
jgi:hypothetical protein